MAKPFNYFVITKMKKDLPGVIKEVDRDIILIGLTAQDNIQQECRG